MSKSEKLVRLLTEYRDLTPFRRSETNALYIHDRVCIGVRELLYAKYGHDFHSENAKARMLEKFTEVVFDSPVADSDHERVLNHLKLGPATGLEIMLFDYPVGTRDIQVHYKDDVRTLVGEVDMVAFDPRNDSLALCEVKTLNTNGTAMALPMIAIYQLFFYKRLIQKATMGALKNITLYAVVVNKDKCKCWKINHVPDQDAMEECFIN